MPKNKEKQPTFGEATCYAIAQAGIDHRGRTRSKFRAGILVGSLVLVVIGVVVAAITLVDVVEWKIPSTPGREAYIPTPSSKAPKAGRARQRMFLPEETVHTSRSPDPARISAADQKVLDVLNKKPDAAPMAIPHSDPAPASASLSDEQVKQTIQRSQRSFQACLDDALRRHDSKGGRMVLSLTVAPSGAVLRAALDNPELDRSALGACLKSACKRMTFPPFQGSSFEVQVPLLLAAP